MANDNQEASVRKNFTFPPSFAARLDKLKEKRGAASDSEIVRSAVNLLEALDDPNCEVIKRRKNDGSEKLVIIV